MKMAKANKSDIDMSIALTNALESMFHAFYKTMPPDPFKTHDFNHDDREPFDPDSAKDCEEAIRRLEKIYDKGSLPRVVMGMAILLDPSNKCVDPDADTLEHHPDLERYHDLLLWTLYHHQGASCHIGQPIRKALSIGPHDRLTPEHVARAKAAASCAPAETPSECNCDAPMDTYAGRVFVDQLTGKRDVQLSAYGKELPDMARLYARPAPSVSQANKPSLPGFEYCIFNGPAPAPFTDWDEWAKAVLKGGMIKDIFIRRTCVDDYKAKNSVEMSQVDIPTVNVGNYRIPVPPVDHWSNPNNKLSANVSHADESAELLKALRWIVNNPGAHPENIRKVAKDAIANASGQGGG